MEKCKGKDEAIENFRFTGKLVSHCIYGSGHINDTFLLTFEDGQGRQSKKILQRMNKDIFARPVELMDNIVNVTTYLRERILENGGDPDRETLNVIPALDGKPYYVDSEGEYWRAYQFIVGASCYDQVEKPEDFYQSAVSFGNFQKLLADFPADTLHETIPGFHDTAARFAALKRAVEKDICGRAASVKEEIAFAYAHEGLGDILGVQELPLRVTHNDTKLNNIMIDDATGKGICVIDLDTVMPSYIFSDVGDFLRTAANTVAEDDPALEKVEFRMDIFKEFMAGYLDSAGVFLTSKELELLPEGAAMFPYMQAVRFLADYINGDTYYKTSYPEHNLVRTRNQMRLLECIEAVIPQMREYIKGIMPS